MYKDNPLLPDKDTAIFNKKKDGMTVEEATIFLMEAKPLPGHPIIIVGDYKRLSPIVLNKCIIIKIEEGK
jgi:hypothetical protein